MKKIIAMIAVMCLCFACAAEIIIEPGEYEQANLFAASDAGADSAFFRRWNADVYCLMGNKVQKNGVIIAELPEDASYPALAADMAGNVYILKNDADETAKSSVICLADAGESYYALEYALPGATGNLSLDSMLFSDESETGALFMTLTANGKQIKVMSVLGVFWGSLTGYDEFIMLDETAGLVYVLPASDFFDAYGYPNDEAAKIIEEAGEGKLVSPTCASLSQDGQQLLISGNTAVYTLDVITLDLKKVNLPEAFSGSVSWSGNSVLAIDENGNAEYIIVTGNENGFDTMFADSWGNGFGW